MKAPDNLPFAYIVVSEGPRQHHVCLRTTSEPEWLRIVATFLDADRADDFADLENTMAQDDDDWHRKEVKEAPPTIELPISNVAVLADRRRGPYQMSGRPRLAHDGVITLADEILKDLPKLIEKFPKGPTINDLCAWLSADRGHVQRAMNEIAQDRRAKIIRRADSSAYHLVPTDYAAPPEELTRKQADVLAVLCAHADGAGLVAISYRQMAEEARTSSGGIIAVLDALRRKRRIEEVATGKGTVASTYRVLDRNTSLISGGPLGAQERFA